MNSIMKAYAYIGLPAAVVFGGRWAYRYYNVNVAVYDVPADLKNHVFIVTGANKGIGRAAVEALAPTGARVIMACENITECKSIRRQIAIDSKNRKIVCRECDLSSFESIKNFAAKIIKEEPRIDVLINNAGVKFLKPRKLTRDSIEKQFAINFLGHYLLTMLLKEKLEDRSGTLTPARVVNVVGHACTKGVIDFEDLNADLKYKPDKAYYQSKLAIVLASKEMAKEFDPSKVSIFDVDPGYTHTDIERHTEPFIRFIRNTFYWLTRRPAKQGAYPLLYAALSFDLQNSTGKYISSQLKSCEIDDVVQCEPVLQRKVWLTAKTWTRLDQAREEVTKILSSLVTATDESAAKTVTV